MFVIKPKNAADWQHAMFMLSYYHVECSLYSNGEDADSTYMVVEAAISTSVDEHRDEEALRMAEMCFQMNWHQHKNKMCPHCADNSDVYDFCGHLSFTQPIDSSAFDKAFG